MPSGASLGWWEQQRGGGLEKAQRMAQERPRKGPRGPGKGPACAGQVASPPYLCCKRAANQCEPVEKARVLARQDSHLSAS